MSDPAHGGAEVVNDGTAIRYTPDPGFFGTDSFGYTIRDRFGQTDTATVTVTVIPPRIVAKNDATATPAGTPVTIGVLANDLGEGLALVQVSDPPHGAATIGGGTVVYTPDPGFASPPDDTFTYTVRDRFRQAATAAVTVTVKPPRAPVAADDAAETNVGAPVAINVLGNDTGTGIAIADLGAPANGTVTRGGNPQEVVYTPRAGFAGTDAFTYTIVDRFGQRSNAATVTVTVRAPRVPVAADDAAETNVGAPVAINVLGNDRGTGIAIADLGAPANGTVTRGGNPQEVVYTPRAGFAGTDAFTYTIVDRFGQRSNAATVTVTVIPPGIVARNDTAATQAGSPVTIGVLANDLGEGLALVQVSDPPHGAATISGGTVVYTPDPGFASPPDDTFTYTVRDRFRQAATAAVTVTVKPPGLSAANDAATTATGTPVTIDVLANDTGESLTLIQVSDPPHGAATIGGNAVVYTPDPGFASPPDDTFTYTVRDRFRQIATATVTVTVTLSKEDRQKQLENATKNPNAQRVGRVIGGLCFDRAASANFLRDCDDLIDAADNDDPGVGPALEQITPAALGVALDTSLTSAQTQMSSIRSRMASLRTGIMGIDLERLNIQRGGWTLSGRDLRYLLASVGGGGPGADVDANWGALGVFASGTFNFGNRDSTDNQAGFDFKTIDVTVGADYRFTDQLILGAALSYIAIDTDADAGGGYLDSRGYGLTLYGTYYPSDRFYVDGMVNYGRNDYDQRRNVAYRVQDVDVNQRFDSDYGGRQLFVDLGTGYEFTYGKLSFGPEIRLSYLDVRVDAFRERPGDGNPGSAWAVAVEEQDLQSLVSSVGGRASYLIDRPWGTLQPQLELGWLHEFEDDSRFVRGRFVEGAVVPDNLFQLAMDPVDKDYFRLGLGLSARFDRGPSALLQYRTLLGSKNLEDHAITAELRWEF